MFSLKNNMDIQDFIELNERTVKHAYWTTLIVLDILFYISK